MDHRAPYGVFRTKTQPIYVAVAGEEDWKKFCNALNLFDLLSDDRFSSLMKRVKNKQVLNEAIEDSFSKMESQEITKQLVKVDIPCSPVNNVPEALLDSHVVGRNMVVDLQVSREQTVKVANTPFRLEGGDSRIFSRPPNLGEHTELILEQCF